MLQRALLTWSQRVLVCAQPEHKLVRHTLHLHIAGPLVLKGFEGLDIKI